MSAQRVVRPAEAGIPANPVGDGEGEQADEEEKPRGEVIHGVWWLTALPEAKLALLETWQVLGLGRIPSAFVLMLRYRIKSAKR